MDLTKKRKLDDNNGQQPDLLAAAPQLTLDDARSLLSSFTHDQLLSIVQSAVLRHPDVLSAVRSIADADPAQRKLFVRGLGWDTTTDKLRALFSSYGDIDEAVVILDKATGKSKGYGFVTMKHVDGALLALKEPSKKIDGRMTVTQLAAAGIQGGPVASSVPVGGYDVSNRKIYVANVPYDMPGDRLLAHFSSYGEVEEGPLGYDKATGKSRGYALFVYKTVEAARASLVDPMKTVDGYQLNCKLANEGKRGKPEVGAGVAPGVQGVAPGPGEAQGNGLGMHPPSGMPGPVGGQYGGPGGSYGGFSGGPQLGHPMNSSMGGGGPGLSSVSSQAPSSMGVSGGGYGSGMGGPYGGSHFGGPGSTGYGGAGGLGTGGGGLVGSAGGFGGSGGGMVGSAGGFGGAGGGMVGNTGGLGGVGGGLGGSAGSLGGVGSGMGGAGRGSSLYGGLPASSIGLPSGGYPESAHYSLSASGYGSQHNHPAGTSPATRVPPGGVYQGGNPYY
ncbi:hypothetical protein RHGRI_018354 [Rhododendron griersonianum]|uniref:RRM domain-containing protein n=1 Tax=Rhododendron griersonianum TaxID=479676 RepID=A0AAV6K150_9ERIC|nr:hypothetical protein RHGRI_018354 [Rhododendron griersonianum]